MEAGAAAGGGAGSRELEGGERRDTGSEAPASERATSEPGREGGSERASERASEQAVAPPPRNPPPSRRLTAARPPSPGPVAPAELDQADRERCREKFPY